MNTTLRTMLAEPAASSKQHPTVAEGSESQQRPEQEPLDVWDYAVLNPDAIDVTDTYL